MVAAGEFVRITGAFLLGCAVAVPTLLALSAPSVAGAFSAPPLGIYGDENFTADHGVVGGNGTSESPYLIQSWDVDCSVANDYWRAFVVAGTRAHFVIRDVRVLYCNREDPSILLTNVTNATLENLTFVAAGHGSLSIDYSAGVAVRGGSFRESFGSGIRVTGSAHVSITGISTDRNSVGVTVADSNDVSVENSTFAGDSYAGLRCFQTSNFTAAGNDFLKPSPLGNLGGLHLDFCGTATLANNSFLDSGLVLGGHWASDFANYTITPDNQVDGRPILFFHECHDLQLDGVSVGELIVANCSDVSLRNLEFAHAGYGIHIAHSDNVTLTQSQFANTKVGLMVEQSTRVAIDHNNFETDRGANEYDALVIGSWGVQLDEGYPRGGNWWSAYHGVDNCSAATQRDCSASDGLGDTPYVVGYVPFGDQYQKVDRYPLMAPVNLTNSGPSAAFTTFPLKGNLTTLFAFNATPSSDREDSIGELESRWEFQGDGTWDLNWSHSMVVTQAFPQPGNYTVRLEVRDLDGLTNATGAVITVILGPTERDPPSLRVSSSAAGVPGEPIEIIAHVEDPGGVATVELFYKASWELAFHTIEMRPTGGDDYVARIPSMADGTQLQFYVVASDTWGNEARHPADGPFAVLEVGSSAMPGGPGIWPFAVAVLVAVVVGGAVSVRYIRGAKK